MSEDQREVMRSYEAILPVELSKEELLVKSKVMSECITRIDEIDHDLRDYRARIREEQHELQSKISALAYCIRTGTEDREVECQDLADWKTGKVVTLRLDTDEEIEVREMTQNERQRSLLPTDGE